MSDSRRGKNTQHSLLAMLRQGIYGRLAGYEDVNDADRLRIDPAMRRVVGGRAQTKEAASTSEMSRFETEMLSSRENLTALMNLSGTWIDSVQECAPLDKLILDLDSSQSETYGDQQGSPCGGRRWTSCSTPSAGPVKAPKERRNVLPQRQKTSLPEAGEPEGQASELLAETGS
ncbi:MAG: hypothetical protein GY778_11585 [bacterium]|nr:hypothetical protein [bacterium]